MLVTSKSFVCEKSQDFFLRGMIIAKFEITQKALSTLKPTWVLSAYLSLLNKMKTYFFFCNE